MCKRAARTEPIAGCCLIGPLKNRIVIFDVSIIFTRDLLTHALCYAMASNQQYFRPLRWAAFVQIIYNASSTSRSLDTLPAIPTRNKTRTARAARAAKKRSDSGSTPPTPKTGSSDGAVSTSKANKNVRNFNSAPKEGEAKGAPSVTISDVSADNASVKSGGESAF